MLGSSGCLDESPDVLRTLRRRRPVHPPFEASPVPLDELEELVGVVAAWIQLGERPSALDLYVSVMTRWRPRRAWFAEKCPRLYKIATAVDQDERLQGVWATNFPAPA